MCEVCACGPFFHWSHPHTCDHTFSPFFGTKRPDNNIFGLKIFCFRTSFPVLDHPFLFKTSLYVLECEKKLKIRKFWPFWFKKCAKVQSHIAPPKKVRTHAHRTHISECISHSLPHAHRTCGSAIIRTYASQPTHC